MFLKMWPVQNSLKRGLLMTIEKTQLYFFYLNLLFHLNLLFFNSLIHFHVFKQFIHVLDDNFILFLNDLISNRIIKSNCN